MLFDSDVVLIGTGLAPLVAAQQFLRQGKSVLILNPEYDFFGEDSELPFDPFWPWTPGQLLPKKIEQSRSDAMFAELGPQFPGALETWPKSGEGYQDPLAPYLRSRTRLWMNSVGQAGWPGVEEMYLRAQEGGLRPQILDGLLARSRFPGASKLKADEAPAWQKAVTIPRLGDVDVSRFRNGVREFVRERLGDGFMVTGASPIELIEDGVRYRQDGHARTVRAREAVLVFWTPRLSSWILSLADRFGVKPLPPQGVRVWEEWSLLSREPLDPTVIGGIDDFVVWAETEGDPSGAPANRLGVLRPGPLMKLESIAASMRTAEESWASEESFKRLSRLCHDFLRWEQFTVRSMKPRSILEWEDEASSFIVHRGKFEARVFARADGPIASVVATARAAAGRFDA